MKKKIVKPLISILTTSWNRRYYLEKLAKSLNKQSFKNFEWIIANDGSNDETDKFIRSFSKNAKFRIIYIKSNLRIGKSKLTNILYKKNSGKFLIECDSDDYFFKNSLKNLINLKKKLPKKFERSFGGVCCQNVDTEGKSQTFKYNIIKKTFVLNWQELKKKIDGDATFLTPAKIFKNKKYPEVDFLITESSLLESIYKNKIFILSPKIVKVMNRKANNSVSFGTKLSYTRGSFYTLTISETNNNFFQKNFFLKINTVLNYFRYSLHADIKLSDTIKKFKPFKKNLLYILIYPFSFLFFLRDNIFKDIEKTHIEFDKNIKKAKISVELLSR